MNRRGFLAASAATLAAPAVRAQPAKVIKFAPQADLALLDPHFAPALVTHDAAMAGKVAQRLVALRPG